RTRVAGWWWGGFSSLPCPDSWGHSWFSDARCKHAPMNRGIESPRYTSLHYIRQVRFAGDSPRQAFVQADAVLLQRLAEHLIQPDARPRVRCQRVQLGKLRGQQRAPIGHDDVHGVETRGALLLHFEQLLLQLACAARRRIAGARLAQRVQLARNIYQDLVVVA